MASAASGAWGVYRAAASLRQARFRRFLSELKTGAARVFDQLGHREREAVYQRALAAELEARGWQCELERPVTVSYVASDGKVTVVAHERADIQAVISNATKNPTVAIVEVKRSSPSSAILTEGMNQARRYAAHLKTSGVDVGGVVAVVFSKSKDVPPTVAAEANPLPPSFQTHTCIEIN